LITALQKKEFIENSPSVLSIAQALPWTETVTYRYVEGATIEAGYKTKVKLTDEPNSAGGSVADIDPTLEDKATHLSTKIVEGSYLTENDSDSIMIGANFL